MDPNTKLCKLPTSVIDELVNRLEIDDCWKILMANIPKKLQKNDFRCDISEHNKPKYKTEHFHLIEKESCKFPHSKCTQLLLNEWGVSGHVRPTLGHLLYLLKKVQLYRAADYVAVDLLKQPAPERPKNGPAAEINLEDFAREDSSDVEARLNSINYPTVAVENIKNYYREKEINKNAVTVLPKIVISEISSNTNNEDYPFSPVVTKQTDVKIVNKATEKNDTVSDMIKFSQSVNDDIVPSSSYIPNISILQNTSGSNIESSTSKSSSVDEISENQIYPDFEQIRSSNDNQSKSNTETTTSSTNDLNINVSDNAPSCDVLSTNDLPNLSGLNLKSTSDVAASNSFLPDFEAIHSSKENSTTNNTGLPVCASPLPQNVSYNTSLPHFSYHDLEVATNYFNNEKYSSDDRPGRFLGSGAFSSVYLAIGLVDTDGIDKNSQGTNKKLAVKKIKLGDVDVVKVDDAVSKQFRTEIEILCNYKHENLLSLLGYSCDGCTYCLLYEFAAGGTLKDKLEIRDCKKKLKWKDRIKIATGTSRAISYLHSADTPLIHRDIKAANILLDENNNPKLGDFGLIKLIPNQMSTNTTAHISGTSAYMSPEALRGTVSVKSDTFSFGVVLLELLTSLSPWDKNRGEDDYLVTYATEHKCKDGDITPLLDTDAGNWIENDVNYANEIYDIALKCLQYAKTNRPEMVQVTTFLNNLEDQLL